MKGPTSEPTSTGALYTENKRLPPSSAGGCTGGGCHGDAQPQRHQQHPARVLGQTGFLRRPAARSPVHLALPRDRHGLCNARLISSAGTRDLAAEPCQSSLLLDTSKWGDSSLGRGDACSVHLKPGASPWSTLAAHRAARGRTPGETGQRFGTDRGQLLVQAQDK